MKIYTTLNIGEFHTNQCEDFLITQPIGTNEILIAVLDGCTMGTESVFASHLYGKLLRSIAKKKYYEEFVTQHSTNLQLKLKHVLQDLFIETKDIKRLLDLSTNELLSTLIVGIVNTETHSGEFITIGDGLIYVDGKPFEYEQGDKPDYFAYHLNESFEAWYNAQTQKLRLRNFKDLSISTDGIFTFKTFGSKTHQRPDEEIIQFLLKNNDFKEFDNLLDRKINYLKQENQHYVTDDLAIIRVIV